MACELQRGWQTSILLIHFNRHVREESQMLYWAAVFFVIALVAAIFGFGGLAAGAAGIAKLLFAVFIVLALVALIFGRRMPTG